MRHRIGRHGGGPARSLPNKEGMCDGDSCVALGGDILRDGGSVEVQRRRRVRRRRKSGGGGAGCSGVRGRDSVARRKRRMQRRRRGSGRKAGQPSR